MLIEDLKTLQWRTLRRLCRKVTTEAEVASDVDRDLIFGLMDRIGREGDFAAVKKEIQELWQRVRELDTLQKLSPKGR